MENKITYEVFDEQGTKLFSVRAFRYPPVEILSELEFRDFPNGTYVVKWKTFYRDINKHLRTKRHKNEVSF